jgi:protein TonB
MQGRLIHKVTPAYPPIAIQTRTEGTVVLQAVISRDGRIEQLALVTGHPFLVKAALDAVQQWAYQPTTLNGSPVEVLTTIEVIFKLSR